MWEADRTGDVEGDVRIAAARVDHDDRGTAGLEIDGQIPCGGVEAQLIFHRRRGFAGFGCAKFVTLRLCRMRHGSPSACQGRR